MVERALVLRGALAGVVAGVVAFAFARVWAEPVISRAVAYESARDAAQARLDAAAHLPVAASGPDLFSRGIQANLGIGLGVVLFGAAVGTLFAVVFVVVGRRTGLSPRALALLLGGLALGGVYVVPFLKYPANPPAVGHEDTIRERGLFFLVYVLVSVLGVVGASLLAQALAPRRGWWTAVLVAAGAYAVVLSVVGVLLPSTGEMGQNTELYGRHTTETPQPLLDASGQVAFPGFPADDLFQFRLYALAEQLLLWTVVALVFGALAQRVLRPAPVASAGRVELVAA